MRTRTHARTRPLARTLWLAATWIAFLCGIAEAEEARVTILHTTDLHGALTAWDELADRPAARGLVRIASVIHAAREQGPLLLLDAGDCIQGGAIETFYARGDRAAPEPMMTAMSRLGYDAMTVGNHEFDDGLARLQEARGAAHFPWLAANVVRASDGTNVFEPSFVRDVGAVRVGVIGVTTPAVVSMLDPERLADLRFSSPVEAARREVKRLRGQERCDLVVILAHTGLERDPESGAERPASIPDENWGYRLAADVLGVDAVILGHTHQRIAEIEVSGVLVTQAGQMGEVLGRIDFTLARGSESEPWKVAKREAQLVEVTHETKIDPELDAFAAPYQQNAERGLAEKVGQATSEIAAPRGRFADSALLQLIHRVQLEASGADVSLAALFDPAARIVPGAVTVRDCLRLYPYDNTLVVVELSGAELAETLEHSARYLADYTYEHGRALAVPDMPGYNFDAASGVQYEIDLTQPVGQRISRLTFAGRPLDPERKLKVAVNSYRANGGGGYERIAKAPRVSQSEETIRDLLIAHIRNAGSIGGDFTPEWRLLPEYAATAERPLIDLLVRQGVASREEVLRLGADQPAALGDLAYWLGRAFAWRGTGRSHTFADVPDSLQPWLEGLIERGIPGTPTAKDRFAPFEAVRLPRVLDWSERCARHEQYALSAAPDLAFRSGLVDRVRARSGAALAATSSDTLTRGQLLGVVANLRFPTVRVLETADFHGAILERRTLESGRTFGGSEYLAAYVRRLRADNPLGTVLLSGGDLFQGTMIANLPFGKPVVEQMNALEYTATAIGNHEFDWSADTLERRIHEMKFSALGANIREIASGKRPYWARPDTVVTRRGVRIGVLGLAYRETPEVTLKRHIRHLQFDDDSATAAAAVPGLKSRSDIVVVVGHIPNNSNAELQATFGDEAATGASSSDDDLVRLARGVPGVAAWFGGHSHNRIADKINGVPVMIAGSRGYNVAVCDLVVDPVADRVAESYVELLTTFHDEIEPDPEFEKLIARWNAEIEPIAAQPVGRNAHDLTRSGDESTVGDLVADAMRAAVGADVALQNTGGLRADLPGGTVTKGMVYGVMPFDNVIVTLDLTGAELRLAIEQSLARDRVTQVSGLRYRYDPSLPTLQRVLEITDANGTPIDPERVYRVACNDFMASGGNSYEVLEAGPNRETHDILVRDAIEAYIVERSRNGGQIDVRKDGRIERVGDGS